MRVGSSQRKTQLLLVAAALASISLVVLALDGRRQGVDAAHGASSSPELRDGVDADSSPTVTTGRSGTAAGPAEHPASQPAGEPTRAQPRRMVDVAGIDPDLDPQPFTRLELFEARKRALLEAGEYERLARFESKLAYEDERRDLQRRKRAELKALDEEKRELGRLLAETDDPALRQALRDSRRELKRQREEVHYALVMEKRRAREALRVE